MSSRLFPGFGSGKGTWEGVVKVNSVASNGRDDLEFGDKVLLPASAFKEVSRLRLPFPLTFQVFNDKAAKTVSASVVPTKTGSIVVANGPASAPALAEQYCGVMEFSAPEGQAYIPKWMMGNLKLREGSTARFVTVRDIAPGAYVKLQPHDEAFVELASAIGPRELLETALRNYSVLSKGERIMIEVADAKYHLDILEVKGNTAASAAGAGAPAKSSAANRISLFGNLDLEVDFAPIKGSADAIAAAEAAKLAEAEAAKAAAAEKPKAEAKPASAASSKPSTLAKPGQASSTGSATGRSGGSGPASASSSARPSTPQAKAVASPSARAQAAAAAPGAGRGGMASPPSSSKVLAAATKPGALSPAASSPRGRVSQQQQLSRTSGDNDSDGEGDLQYRRDPLEDSTLLSAGVMWFPGMSAIVKGRTTGGMAVGGGGTVVSGLAAPANGAPLPSAPLASPPVLAPAVSAFSEDASTAPVADVLVPDKAALAAVMRQAALARLRGLTEATKQAAAMSSPARGVAALSLGNSPSKAPLAAAGTVRSGWMTAEAAAHHSGSPDSSPPMRQTPPMRHTPLSDREAKEADIEEEEERIRRSMALRQHHQQQQPQHSHYPYPQGDHHDYPEEKKSDTLSSRSPAGQGVSSSSVGFKPAAGPARATATAAAKPILAAADIPVDDEGKKQCPTCGTRVLAGNYPLHAVQCARNPAFHRVNCDSCGASIFKKDVPRHHHCPDCTELIDVEEEEAVDKALQRHRANVCKNALLPCECGQSFPRAAMAFHRENECLKATFPCRYCKVHFKKAMLGPHEDKCGARTGECEHCGKRVVMKAMQQHLDDACPILHPPPTPPPAAAAELPVATLNTSPLGLGSGMGMGMDGQDGYLDAGDGGLGVVVDSAHHDGIARYMASASGGAGTTAKPTLSTAAGSGFSASASAATAAALGAALGLGKTAGAKAVPAAAPNAKAPAIRTPSKVAAPPSAADRDSKPVRNATHSDMSCPHCFSRCVDYEALQMHVFTACPKAAKAMGLDFAGAAAPAVSTAAPSSASGPLSPLSSAVQAQDAKNKRSVTGGLAATTSTSTGSRPGSAGASGPARPGSAGSVAGGAGIGASSSVGMTRKTSFGSSGLGATGAAVIGSSASSSLSSRGAPVAAAGAGPSATRTVAVGGVKRVGPGSLGAGAAPASSSSLRR